MKKQMFACAFVLGASMFVSAQQAPPASTPPTFPSDRASRLRHRHLVQILCRRTRRHRHDFAIDGTGRERECFFDAERPGQQLWQSAVDSGLH